MSARVRVRSRLSLAGARLTQGAVNYNMSLLETCSPQDMGAWIRHWQGACPRRTGPRRTGPRGPDRG